MEAKRRGEFSTLQCSVETCSGPSISPQGYCNPHYLKWLKRGSTDALTAPYGLTPVERFLYQCVSGTSDECWEWTGARVSKGYGNFTVTVDGKQKSFTTHIVAWEIANGQKVPQGFVVRHKCDNPPCVNPNHLELGTHKDNKRDQLDRGRFTPQLGEAHGCAKLTETQVLEIRTLVGHVSRRRLAELYRVSLPTIQAIVSGRLWKHLL